MVPVTLGIHASNEEAVLVRQLAETNSLIRLGAGTFWGSLWAKAATSVARQVIARAQLQYAFVSIWLHQLMEFSSQAIDEKILIPIDKVGYSHINRSTRLVIKLLDEISDVCIGI